MPAVAGNHPGHQPGTTQARHVTGQGQLPFAHKGPNFVSVMRLQLTGGAARRTQTPVPLWIAAIRLNATASDKTARHCPEKVRIRPLPVPVSWRTASASRARRAGPVGHASWERTSSRLRVGDCSALAESDQRTDPRRAPGIGESAGIRIVHMPYVVEQDEDGVW